MATELISSDELFNLLKKFIHIPDEVVRCSIILEPGQPVDMTIDVNAAKQTDAEYPETETIEYLLIRKPE